MAGVGRISRCKYSISIVDFDFDFKPQNRNRLRATKSKSKIKIEIEIDIEEILLVVIPTTEMILGFASRYACLGDLDKWAASRLQVACK